MARRKKGEVQDKSYEILIGFIHHWEYKDKSLQTKKMHGHPLMGRVYRLIKDPHGYRIHIGRENNELMLDGLLLGDSLNGETNQFIYNIELVTPENYFTLPIIKDDQSKLLSWIESENEDLWSKIRGEVDGSVAVIKSFAELLQLVRSSPNQVESVHAELVEPDISTKQQAAESAVEIMLHFKNKSTDELLKLFDGMYDRILKITYR